MNAAPLFQLSVPLLEAASIKQNANQAAKLLCGAGTMNNQTTKQPTKPTTQQPNKRIHCLTKKNSIFPIIILSLFLLFSDAEITVFNLGSHHHG